MSNAVKSKALGVAHGTAANRLRKNILFSLVCRLALNECYQCGEEIISVDDLSIEHKEPWLQADDPVKSFFDLDNIAFSHLSCNVKAGSRPTKIYENEQEKKRARDKRRSRYPQRIENMKRYRKKYNEKKV